MKNIFIRTVANGFILTDADQMRAGLGNVIGPDLDTHVFANVETLCLALPRLLSDEHTVFAKSECAK